MDTLFEINHLQCSYDKHPQPGRSKIVLDIEHLELPKGKKVFIVGESGIGKSTILEVLGLMNNTVIPNEKSRFTFYDKGVPVDILQMWKRKNDRELSEFRRNHFNFIFQSTNLMRNFTAYENISITRMLQGYSQTSTYAIAKKVLDDLGLGHIDEVRMAQELSGGQQQRLAFARAILPDFTVLFGDEPTGNLDSENAVRAMELLSNKLAELQGSSAIIVSHDMNLAVSFADIIVKVKKVEVNPQNAHEEPSFYGHIDDTCVYRKTNEGNWANGTNCIDSIHFVSFLKSLN